MPDPTTTSGGSGENEVRSEPTAPGAELAGGRERSVLVGTNRTDREVDPSYAGPLAHLKAGREALNQAEYWCGVLAHELHHLPGEKARIDHARAQIQGAHGLLWDVSRELAAGGPGEPL